MQGRMPQSPLGQILQNVIVPVVGLRAGGDAAIYYVVKARLAQPSRDSCEKINLQYDRALRT